MFTIENKQLRITINPKGAELSSIYHKGTQLEYLWQADPAFWGKHSPVLFPIVGSLKKDTYYMDGIAYSMGRHGFARELDFAVGEQADHAISFFITSDEKTLLKFPFLFRFTVSYTLDEDRLLVSYAVTNTDDKPLYFSVGGHPAFKVPLAAETSYEDYYLEFNETEDTGRWPISPEGLIEAASIPLLEHTRRLPLTKELFLKDALVFKDLRSKVVKLLSDTTTHGLEFDFHGFPYLGIWAAKQADFVCIEPWCGIADSVNSSQQLPEKEGIHQLPPQGLFERSWSARFF